MEVKGALNKWVKNISQIGALRNVPLGFLKLNGITNPPEFAQPRTVTCAEMGPAPF